jgi:hypothetical protein
MSAYTTFLREAAKISAHAPVVRNPMLSYDTAPDASLSSARQLTQCKWKQAHTTTQGKAPRNLNAHMLVESPFQRTWPQPESAEYLQQLPLQRKSEQYMRSGMPPAGTSDVAQVTNVPLPHVLRRHILAPSSTLGKESNAGKIAGYRIEVNGRRGSRSVKSVVSYGKLDSKDLVGSGVDFARSHFVTKRGSTGVKVWIAYAK